MSTLEWLQPLPLSVSPLASFPLSASLPLLASFPVSVSASFSVSASVSVCYQE
jgi:hypothetical protein